MNVGLAADCRRVSKTFRYLREKLFEGEAFPARAAELAQRFKCQHTPVPGAEVLRGEALAAQRVQEIVDIARADGMELAVRIAVLEQFLPRQMQATADHTQHARILDLDFVAHAALAAEGQLQGIAFDPHMPIA